MCLRFDSNSASSVVDCENASRLILRKLCPDCTTRHRIFDGIVQEVHEQTPQKFCVAFDHYLRGGRRERKCYASLLCKMFKWPNALCNGLPEKKISPGDRV